MIINNCIALRAITFAFVIFCGTVLCGAYDKNDDSRPVTVKKRMSPITMEPQPSKRVRIRKSSLDLGVAGVGACLELLEKKVYKSSYNCFQVISMSKNNSAFEKGLALHQLGMLRISGYGVQRNITLGLSILQQSWDQYKYLNSAKSLGSCMFHLRQAQKAIYWYALGAKEGDSESMFKLGTLFLHGAENDQYPHKDTSLGDRIFPHPTLAKLFFQYAALNGNLPASHALGMLELQQKKPDIKAAISYLSMAGFTHSYYWLGFIYENGIQGTKVDLYLAAQYYKMSESIGAISLRNLLRTVFLNAKANDPEACFVAGQCLQHGIGIPINQELAYSYFIIAAENGIVEAHTHAGYLALSKSPASAVTHFCNGHAEGSMASRKALADCYLRGLGVPADNQVAEFLLSLSNPSSPVIEEPLMIPNQLSLSEILTIQDFIASFSRDVWNVDNNELTVLPLNHIHPNLPLATTTTTTSDNVETEKETRNESIQSAPKTNIGKDKIGVNEQTLADELFSAILSEWTFLAPNDLK